MLALRAHGPPGTVLTCSARVFHALLTTGPGGQLSHPRPAEEEPEVEVAWGRPARTWQNQDVGAGQPGPRAPTLCALLSTPGVRDPTPLSAQAERVSCLFH